MTVSPVYDTHCPQISVTMRTHYEGTRTWPLHSLHKTAWSLPFCCSVQQHRYLQLEWLLSRQCDVAGDCSCFNDRKLLSFSIFVAVRKLYANSPILTKMWHSCSQVPQHIKGVMIIIAHLSESIFRQYDLDLKLSHNYVVVACSELISLQMRFKIHEAPQGT